MTKNARAVLKQFVEAIEQDDISPTMSTGFEKAYQNALAVLQEPDTAPAEADKRDAERYRWLRATDPIEWPISLSADSILAPDYFDAAIDAAQKEASEC